MESFSSLFDCSCRSKLSRVRPRASVARSSRTRKSLDGAAKNFRPVFALSVLLSSCLYTAETVFAHPDHGEVLHHWEIPSKDPDRIVLTWSEDPATTQSVTWRTSDEIGQAFAEIAVSHRSSRFDLNATRLEAATERLEIGRSDRNQDRVDHFHSVVFRNLEPDTLYAYRVGDGGEYWSEWIQFRTARAEPAPVRFLYFGDAQNGVLSHWSRIIRAAYQKAPHANFTIHAGDLVNRAHRDREWAEWFKAGGWIHASLPSVPVPGNHEYGSLTEQEEERRVSLQWRPQFTLPIEAGLPESLAETVYTLRYQGILIVAMNSNREIEAQAQWLEKLLATDDSRWRVLTFHHPIFSSGRDRDNKERRDLWKPIIDKHSVDLILQGHDHTYARGHTPVRMSEESGPDVATMYVNSVSGAKMYEFMKDGWNVYRPEGVVLDRRGENAQFFQVISIDGGTLIYKAYTADGKAYDMFTLTKDESGKKTLYQGDANDLGEESSFENGLPYSREGM